MESNSNVVHLFILLKVTLSARNFSTLAITYYTINFEMGYELTSMRASTSIIAPIYFLDIIS